MKSFLLCVVTVAAVSAACGQAPADSLLAWDNSQKAGLDDGGTTSSGSGGGGGGGGSSDAGSTGGGGNAGGSGTVAGATGVPCDVATVFAEKCTGCHSDPPVNGSLSGLVTLTDLQATAKEDATKTEIQLSVVRMQSTTSPMPPTSVGNPATAADIATLQNWITAGTPAGACDAGAVGGGGGSNVFTGQPAFATKAGPNGNHNVGRDCLSCHDGTGEADQFTFAGTMYDGSGNPVAGAEVRVVDAAGKAISVYTATDGNFYSKGGRFAAPGHAGARNGAATDLMVSAVTNGGCNSCHCTGGSCTTAPLHLP